MRHSSVHICHVGMRPNYTYICCLITVRHMSADITSLRRNNEQENTLIIQ